MNTLCKIIKQDTIVVLDFDQTITFGHTNGCALPHQVTRFFSGLIPCKGHLVIF